MMHGHEKSELPRFPQKDWFGSVQQRERAGSRIAGTVIVAASYGGEHANRDGEGQDRNDYCSNHGFLPLV
jgi:hypothetical protein